MASALSTPRRCAESDQRSRDGDIDSQSGVAHMSVLAFVVKVPAAELLVGELRMRFDASCRQGTPAHITVLFPFTPTADITPTAIHRAQIVSGVVPSSSFSFAAIRRFMGHRQVPATLFLSPDPPEPFVASTTAPVGAFSMFGPYDGSYEDVVPHLTVAHGDALEVHAPSIELTQRVRTSALIQRACNAVVLLGNTSGQ